MGKWIRPQDLWKCGTIVVLVATAVSTHQIGLPVRLQPYIEWIDFIAGVGAVVLAYHMQKPEEPT